jgi:type I restriction enzyme S subunit
MERYQEYKPSGVEWIPEIPIGWEVKKLKHCFKFTVGGTPSTSKASYFEGDNTWVTIADMHQRVITDSKTCISNEGIAAASMEIVPKGSLMYSFKLSVGKVAFAGKELYTNEAIFSVLPGADYDLTYFYFALPELLVHSAGRNIYGAKIFNQELLKNAFIALPTLSEQLVITRFLDDKTAQVDQLITQKQQMLTLLQEERAALINHAVTKGLDAAAQVRDSGIEWLGDVPAHWEVKKLKFLIYSTKGGGTPSTENTDFWNGSIPWVSPKDMKVDFISESQDYITDVAVENSSVVLIEPNSILMVVRSGILKHTLPVAINTVPVTLNQDMKAFIPVPGVDAHYFWHLLKGLESEVLTFCTKIGATVDSMEMEYLQNFEVPIPPLKEQIPICEHINAGKDRITKAVTAINQEIALLQEYRAALIAEAVTGQIDVRHYEPVPSLTAELVG